MILRLFFTSALVLSAGSVFAQTQTSGTSTTSMKQLLEEGYEIKTAVPNGSKFVVFMQKEQSAYACEFVSVTQTRCGAIN